MILEAASVTSLYYADMQSSLHVQRPKPLGYKRPVGLWICCRQRQQPSLLHMLPAYLHERPHQREGNDCTGHKHWL